ncbi:hypothetical protein V1502_18905 [Bacillus sp. SCS-153A]|uniref:hypothetical protein n=1 Tax=Rossellomorea sedimentorum TaxID=3115294 RepID=UPI003906CB15
MFVYKQWEYFCEKLSDNGINSVTAASVLKTKQENPFLILKHDVETNPSKALKLAQIESKYSHQGSYYVQAYLLENKKNVDILKKIQSLGHEVSYHHDVMDSNKGDIKKAQQEFQTYVDLFEKHGFSIETVCQHGNPVIEREGYSSNRDFFRDKLVAQTYKYISEIMVDFKNRININYKYISDAGYGWKIIFDPENNDVVKSDDKNTSLGDLNRVYDVITSGDSVIVSTHPHRWNSNEVSAQIKDTVFKIIKNIAKLMLKVPLMKRLMGRFYYLAKKI